MKRNSGKILIVLGSLIVCGCASLKAPPEPHDPWERYNRAMYHFNDSVDNAVLKPVAKGYKFITPDPVEHGVSNFFNNIKEIRNLLNALLQGKLVNALSDTGRFITNSTLGIGGIFDVATHFGLEKHEEDFGQTLGKWGVGNGPYLVLPFLGSSSLRDTGGFVVDEATNPFRLVDNDRDRNSLYALSLIKSRANLLNATDIVDQAALDPYRFIREAYFQLRLNQVHDGKPPATTEEDEIDIFEEL